MRIVGIDVARPFTIFPDHVKRLEEIGDVKLYNTKPKDVRELIERMNEADVVIDFWTPIGNETMNALDGTKLICVASSGYEWVDVKTAKEKGTLVTHCPGHNAQAVAEHTLGLTLYAARLAQKAHDDLKSGKWDPESYIGIELRGKTVGIIGYGQVGKKVEHLFKSAFGCNVIWTNSKSPDKDLRELLRKSDIITLHTPLTDKTKCVLGEKEFAMMKDSVIIVNAARGPLIDATALEANVISGKVMAAGLDNYEPEPLPKDSPLLKLDRVVTTPHIAWNTKEMYYNLSEQITQIVEAFASGSPIHVVSEHQTEWL